jgi:hypothetical protein
MRRLRNSLHILHTVGADARMVLPLAEIFIDTAV